jgi:hypothetical protein
MKETSGIVVVIGDVELVVVVNAPSLVSADPFHLTYPKPTTATTTIPKTIPNFGIFLTSTRVSKPDVAVAMIGISVRAIVGRLLSTDKGLPQPAQYASLRELGDPHSEQKLMFTIPSGMQQSDLTQ